MESYMTMMFEKGNIHLELRWLIIQLLCISGMCFGNWISTLAAVLRGYLGFSLLDWTYRAHSIADEEDGIRRISSKWSYSTYQSGTIFKIGRAAH
jgi:hypothetical protein